MRHEDYKELLAANALTALDVENARSLDTHLESCGECRSEMRVWHDTAALLALDAAALEPSPQAREQLLASVRAERAKKASQTRDYAPDYDRAAPTDGSSASKVLPFEQPRRNIWTSPGSFGVIGSIAATLVGVGLVVALFLLWQQNRSAQAELARLATEMREAKEQLAREREAVELLSSPGARMAQLAGTVAAPGAHAMLAYDKKGHAMLMAKGLPAAPKGMAYQLWFIVGKKPMPGKVFSTDAAGNASLEDQIPNEALDTAVFAITLEPEGGMPSPTGAMYLSSGG
jgi:anti-sigma-K factor RskA